MKSDNTLDAYQAYFRDHAILFPKERTRQYCRHMPCLKRFNSQKYQILCTTEVQVPGFIVGYFIPAYAWITICLRLI